MTGKVGRCIVAGSMIPRRKKADGGNECCVLASCGERSSAGGNSVFSSNGFVFFCPFLFVYLVSIAKTQGP